MSKHMSRATQMIEKSERKEQENTDGKLCEKELRKILLRESSHFQWVKLALNLAMLAILFVISVLKGHKNGPSVIGVSRCTTADWVMIAALIVLGFVFLGLSVWYIQKEHDDKVRKGYQFVPGDFECTVRSVLILNATSLGGGFMVGCAGVSPSLIFNSFLMLLNVNPTVASATGQYMVIYTTLASSIVKIVEGDVNWIYGLMIVFYVIIGTLPGLYL